MTHHGFDPEHTRRGEPAHDRLFAALAPGNQAWAGAAQGGLAVHQMGGFDTGAVRAEFDLGEEAPHAQPTTARQVT